MIPGTSSLFPLNHCLVHLPYVGVEQATLSLDLYPSSLLSNPFPKSHISIPEQCSKALKVSNDSTDSIWEGWSWALVYLLLFFFSDWSIYQLSSLSKGISPCLLSSPLSMQAWFPCSVEMLLPRSLVTFILPKIVSLSSPFSASQQCLT